MELIKERQKRTIRRKIAKNKFDNMFTLSASAPNKGVLLLDEGTVVTSEGNVWFYIEKGVLERFLDSLDDDFVGYINYGHNEFATDPILLGEYKKSDFTLEKHEDGRSTLYVRPHFYDTYRLKDLKAMPFDVGVSAEMNVSMNDEATEKLGFDVVNDLFISGFAVVGECGNVNSSGVTLGGGNMDLKALTDALENQTTLDLAALSDAFKDEAEETTEEVTAAVDEDGVADADETGEADVAAEDEAEGEVTASVAEDNEDSKDDVLETIKKLSEKVEKLEAENARLTEQIESFQSANTELAEKLSVKEREEKEFIEKFKGLSLKADKPAEKHEVKELSIAMDGIGE